MKKYIVVIGLPLIYFLASIWIWKSVIDPNDKYFNSDNWKLALLYWGGVLIVFAVLRWLAGKLNWEWLR